MVAEVMDEILLRFGRGKPKENSPRSSTEDMACGVDVGTVAA